MKNINFKDGCNDLESIKKLGIPSKIWHKKWLEEFNLIQYKNLIGYKNNNGWYFNAKNKNEFIEKYSLLKNRGIIKILK